MHVRVKSRDACKWCGSAVFPAGSSDAIAHPNQRATRDHVRPQFFRTLSCKAVDHTDNIVVSCALCNNVKGGYPHEPFVFFLKATRGTPLFSPAEFKKFIFGLSLAGFKAARRDALSRQVKVLPPRGPQGRFTKRDLMRGARA